MALHFTLTYLRISRADLTPSTSGVNLKQPEPVMAGESVTLHCAADSPDAFTGNPTVNWFYANNGSIFTHGIESGKPELTLTSTTKNNFT